MEIFVALFLLWIFVTLIGHASYVLIRGLIVAIFGQPALEPKSSKESDLDATQRVIWQLAQRELMTPAELERLQDSIGKLTVPINELDLPSPESDAQPAASPPQQMVSGEQPDENEVSVPAQFVAGDSGSACEPILAELILEEPLEPPPPAISKAEVIRSFLAANNIRWGELVAGMLIVVCSIGLVISLWSTVITQHRIIPSLIFLSANAAIYAAGFYTLRRWRLAQTSRAVLAIATLMVPLTVLTGIAASASGPKAVDLTDPLTVLAIAIAGVVYGTLLHRGGIALGRRSYALPMTLAVAGPVAMIPLVPAAVRNFESSAGWIVGFGSIGIAVALSRMSRMRLRTAQSLGPVSGRTRMMVMAFAAFAMSVLVGYALVAIKPFGQQAVMAIAMAALPALAALSAAGLSLAIDARRSSQSMVGAVVCAVLMGLCWIVLPPATVSTQWLWSWGIVLSISMAAATWMFREPRWLAIASLPIGIVATLSSPVWLGSLAWSDVGFWNRCIAGEPMLASAMIGTVVGGLWLGTIPQMFKTEKGVRPQLPERPKGCFAQLGPDPFFDAQPLASDQANPSLSRWLGYAAIFWLSVSLSIAILLTFAPLSLLGMAPAWTVTAVLLIGGWVSARLANRHRALAAATVIATSFAAASVFRPFGTERLLDFAPPLVWVQTFMAISAGLLIITELATRQAWPLVRQKHRTGDHSSCDGTRDGGNENRTAGAEPYAESSIGDLWNGSACLAGAIAAVIACTIAPSDWSTSAWALAMIAGLLGWSATLSRSIIPWMVCQLSTVALSVVLAFGHCNESLFSIDGWKIGTSPFGWVIIGGLVVAFWLAIRQLAVVTQVASNGRLRHFRPDHQSVENLPIGWISMIAVVLLAIGSTWSFASLISSAIGSNAVVFDTPWFVPTIAFALFSGIIVWIRWQECQTMDDRSDRFAGFLAAVVGAGAVAWSAYEVACLFAVNPQVRLVNATSLASILYMLGAKHCARKYGGVEKGSSFLPRDHVRRLSRFLVAGMIGLSSAALLRSGWLEPIFAGQYADRFSTLAVFTWWAAGAVVLFFRANRHLEPLSGLASSLLAPASAALLVPVFYQVHPVVWFQVAAIVSAIWLLAAHWVMDREQTAAAESAISLSAGILMIAGVGSAVLAILFTVFGVTEFRFVVGFAGLCISTIAIGYWSVVGLRPGRSDDDGSIRLPWIAGIALLSGQFGWAAGALGLVSGIEMIELIAAVWLATSIAALLRYDRYRLAAIQVVGIAVLLLTVDAFAGRQSVRTPSLAIAGLCCVGCLVALATWSQNRSVGSRLTYRFLGWGVIAAGVYLLTSRVGLPATDEIFWTVLVGWASLWVILWRIVGCHGQATGHASIVRGFGGLPDMDFAVLLGLAALGEAIMTTAAGIDSYSLAKSLLIVRVISLMAVAVSVQYRADRRIAWTTSIVTCCSVIAIVSVQLAIHFGANPGGRFASALLPCGFVIALLANWIAPIASGLSKFSAASPDRIGSSLAESAWQVSLVVAGLAGYASIAMIISQTAPAETNMTIVAVALSAWSVATIADTCNRSSLRHTAVSLALGAIGLWASVNPLDTIHPVLTASMRWLVASVFTIAMVLFVVPKLLGPTIANRWRDALTVGAMVAAIAAGLALIGMLVQEALLRSAQGIDGISPALVIGVAVTLSILSGLAGLISIISGPTSNWRARLNLSDRQRVGLIYIAQALGAITWLHVFLCKSQWAFIGLRGYWPYIVMGLAFLSVGATEWARRHGDKLLSDTLKNTSLYLPLIPVIGFWFGASAGPLEWLFDQGKVRYDVLLAWGAAYYVAVSAIWKDVVPRIAAVVLGNAAWWIVLVQQDGWGFLAHPQMWLIPPAVCALVVVHLYRNRLQVGVASAVRYVATLVIYVSSTADMLLQQIGQNISGPIILVLLALVGMAVGVILRVRPFLYLGAMFVLIGVTSMVWHAAVSIDQVWPWWVFGITTGILLLGGLMALEKNKPKLRQYADHLSAWQE